MNACGHDCEFCELVETCAQAIALEFKSNRQRERESRKIEAPCDGTFYVYVAGRLSGNPAEYLANMHDMCAMSRALMEAGYCPINPGADALEGLMSGEMLPTSHYQSRSMDLLRLLAGHRAAVLVGETHHRDGRASGGTFREVEEAQRLGVPVCWSVEELAQVRGSEP